MHFLMPAVFASHDQFKSWFSNPLTGMVEGQQAVNKDIVGRLHNVLRPFLLRRLKCDVEKQLPQKHEHVVLCRLSRRQRTLYEDYLSSSDVRATMASGNFLGMINCLMQLRKVCNHPDLFEGRAIVSPLDMPPLPCSVPSLVPRALQLLPLAPSRAPQGIAAMELVPAWHEGMTQWQVLCIEVRLIATRGWCVQGCACCAVLQHASMRDPVHSRISTIV